MSLPTPTPWSVVVGNGVEAIGRKVAKYDLTLMLAGDGSALEGWLEYATSLYRRATAEKILDQYRLLLAAVVARPDLPLSSVWRGLR